MKLDLACGHRWKRGRSANEKTVIFKPALVVMMAMHDLGSQELCLGGMSSPVIKVMQMEGTAASMSRVLVSPPDGRR